MDTSVTIGRSSTDFNPSSSAALGLTCLVGVFAIVSLTTPWSVFKHDIEGTNTRLEGRIFLHKICYDCQSVSAGANQCDIYPSTCVNSGVGGSTATIVTLSLALVFIVASIVADLGRIFIDCLRPHRDVMIPALVGLSSLLFMLSFSIYSGSSGSTVLELSSGTGSIAIPLSVAHQGVGFILTIFSWLISLFVVLPLFWLISRTHDFHNFLSHTSKARATRSATMSHIGPQNLSCAPNQLSPYTESNSREASKSQHGNASVELSVEQQKPKAGSHKIASSDMDLSRYLPRDMSLIQPPVTGSPPSHHHSLSLPPTKLSLAAPDNGRHQPSRSVDLPTSRSAPSNRSPLGALQSQRAPPPIPPRPQSNSAHQPPPSPRPRPNSHTGPDDTGLDSLDSVENTDVQITVNGHATSGNVRDSGSAEGAETGDIRITEGKGDGGGLEQPIVSGTGPKSVAPVVLTPVSTQSGTSDTGEQ